MSDFIILADSSCDLNKEQRERYDIADYIPGTLIHPNGNDGPADLDWNNISYEEFYTNMKNDKLLYKTATPTPANVYDKLEKYLKQGKDILYISLSTGLSGTYSLVSSIAKELNQKYANKIIAIDSLKYSGGIAMLLIKASELRSEGKSIDETASIISDLRYNLHQMGPMDDLFFMKRMGRMPAVATVMGTLISLKLMADFDRKGISHVVGKVKGNKKALKTTVNYVKALIRDAKDQTLIINNSMREEHAEKLKELIMQEVKPKAIEMVHVGQSCGATIGPGLVAVYFFGEPLSEDMSKEKGVFDSAAK